MCLSVRWSDLESEIQRGNHAGVRQIQHRASLARQAIASACSFRNHFAQRVRSFHQVRWTALLHQGGGGFHVQSGHSSTWQSAFSDTTYITSPDEPFAESISKLDLALEKITINHYAARDSWGRAFAFFNSGAIRNCGVAESSLVFDADP